MVGTKNIYRSKLLKAVGSQFEKKLGFHPLSGKVYAICGVDSMGRLGKLSERLL